MVQRTRGIQVILLDNDGQGDAMLLPVRGVMIHKNVWTISEVKGGLS